MASIRRVEKLQTLLRKELARIVDRELEFPEGNMATITRISLSPDLRYATIFISIMGDNDETLEIFRKNTYHLQQILNRLLRMRPVPKISFAIDEEQMRRERVEQSIAELKRKGEI